MGTRADFYIGRGESAEWLGSIAWDGYPDGIPDYVLKAKGEHAFRDVVAKFLAEREDKTLPADGWPWPWEDSRTTDYAYAWDGEEVHACCFGHGWFSAAYPPEDHIITQEKSAIFPNMKNAKQREKFGPHSGVILITTAGA